MLISDNKSFQCLKMVLWRGRPILSKEFRKQTITILRWTQLIMKTGSYQYFRKYISVAIDDIYLLIAWLVFYLELIYWIWYLTVNTLHILQNVGKFQCGSKTKLKKEGVTERLSHWKSCSCVKANRLSSEFCSCCLENCLNRKLILKFNLKQKLLNIQYHLLVHTISLESFNKYRLYQIAIFWREYERSKK